MKTSNQKLIEFHKGKSDLIYELTGIATYGCDHDYAELAEWPKRIADEVWNRIKIFVGTGTIRGLCDLVCAWCNLHLHHEDYCSVCGYGERHGICSTYSSEWEVAVLALYKLKEYPLSNSFYRELIEKIEREDF